MSLTALVFITGFFGCMVLAFVRHPIYGLYGYLLTFYLGPDTAWWGQSIPNLRWSLLSAATTFVAALMCKTPSGRPPWYRHSSGRVLMLFAVWLWIQAGWALDIDDHVFLATLFTKYVLMFVLIYTVLDTPERIHNFVLVNIIGCFYWGYLAWQAVGGGRIEAIGTGDVAGSAFASMHISTIVALAGFMFLGFSGWKKWLPFAAIPFILNAIVRMQTRGAFVGLLGAVPMALLLAPKRKRRAVVLYILLGSLLFLRVADHAFWERMATIEPAENQQMEASAASRLDIAEANLRMFRDHPMGVGHRGNDLLSPKYMRETLLTDKGGVQVRSAHNTVMAILVDHGIVGIILIVLFHARIAGSILRLRKKGLQLPIESQALVGGLATGLLIYWINGQFANMTKAEVVIWIAALAASLEALYSLPEKQPVTGVAPWAPTALQTKAQ